MKKGMDVITFFSMNPPFEISDQEKYLQKLTDISNITLDEFSECFPDIGKKVFKTPTLLELEDRDEMIYPNGTFDFNIHEEIENLLKLKYIQESSFDFSLINPKEIDESDLEEFIMFDEFIRLKPEQEYFCFYLKRKGIDDLKRKDIKNFFNLLEVNFILHVYNSDIFASEAGIKSVSLSGLSVSFNVSENKDIITQLRKKKR